MGRRMGGDGLQGAVGGVGRWVALGGGWYWAVGGVGRRVALGGRWRWAAMGGVERRLVASGGNEKSRLRKALVCCYGRYCDIFSLRIVFRDRLNPMKLVEFLQGSGRALKILQPMYLIFFLPNSDLGLDK